MCKGIIMGYIQARRMRAPFILIYMIPLIHYSAIPTRRTGWEFCSGTQKLNYKLGKRLSNLYRADISLVGILHSLSLGVQESVTFGQKKGVNVGKRNGLCAWEYGQSTKYFIFRALSYTRTSVCSRNPSQ